MYATTAFDDAETTIGMRGWSGHLVWETTVDAGIQSLVVTDEGRLLVAGSQAADSETSRAWIAELDEHGELLWEQTLSAEGAYRTATHVGGDSSGVWVLGQETRIGTETPNPETTVRPFVARLNEEGEVAWEQTLGEWSIYPLGLAVDPGGDAIVGMRLNGTDLEIADMRYESSYIATLLVRFDVEGTAVWSAEVGETTDDEMESLARGNDGTLYVTGTRERHDLGFTANKTFVAAVTANGKVLWRRDYEEGHQMTDSRLFEHPCGGFVLSANWSADGASGTVIFELDDEGDETGRRVFAGDDYVFASHIAVHGDGISVLGQFRGALDLGMSGGVESEANAAFLTRLTD